MTPDLSISVKATRQSLFVSAIVPFLATLCLVASFWFAWTTLSGFKSAENEASKVFDLRTKTDKLLITIEDAETGQRGYLLTGSLSYLTPYTDARLTLDQALSKLKTASPASERRLIVIQRLVISKLAELAGTIALYQAGYSGHAIQFVRRNTGKFLMDAIRLELNKLQADVDVRLIETEAHVDSTWAWGRVVGLGAVSCALLAGLAFAHQRAPVRGVACYRSSSVSLMLSVWRRGCCGS